eukprot:TRINITY_DN2679_c0_g2_i3.p1 TRINITY_DN2679_c0_g2~~TRINITY_DN2679_c0_g2_i3.p1  ORF type:complete len:128 (-),score=2.82 TRINITY_DN2679_c0_g2_i3:1162-1545(-)
MQMAYYEATDMQKRKKLTAYYEAKGLASECRGQCNVNAKYTHCLQRGTTHIEMNHSHDGAGCDAEPAKKIPTCKANVITIAYEEAKHTSNGFGQWMALDIKPSRPKCKAKQKDTHCLRRGSTPIEWT